MPRGDRKTDPRRRERQTVRGSEDGRRLAAAKRQQMQLPPRDGTAIGEDFIEFQHRYGKDALPFQPVDKFGSGEMGRYELE